MAGRDRVIEELNKIFPSLEQKFDADGNIFSPDGLPSIDEQETYDLAIKHDELVMLSAALIVMLPDTPMIAGIIATKRIQQYIKDHLSPDAIQDLIERLDEVHRLMHNDGPAGHPL